METIENVIEEIKKYPQLYHLLEEELLLRPLDFLLKIITFFPIKENSSINELNDFKNYLLKSNNKIQLFQKKIETEEFNKILIKTLKEILELYKIKSYKNKKQEIEIETEEIFNLISQITEN